MSVAVTQTKGRILLVDDNQNLIEAITLVLTGSGFEVSSATGAEEALALLEPFAPDLIISDIMMDGMDGFDFYAEVREECCRAELPFVFLSSRSDAETIRRGKAEGCDDYLIKPFHPDDLLAVVEGKISTSKKRKELSEKQVGFYRKNIIQTLSHEFRTPLVSVYSGSELLLVKLLETGDEELIQLCRSIFRGGARLQALVEDFMTLRQIESGQAEKVANNQSELLSLWGLLEETTGYYRDCRLKEGENFELIPFVEPGLETKPVSVCERQVADVVGRLLNNALRYGNPQKPAKVWLAASTPESLSIFIRDYGPGLPASQIACAKELFGQLNRERNEQQGCGLGLTIASYYTELNGGEVLFSNLEDEEGGLQVEVRFGVEG